MPSRAMTSGCLFSTAIEFTIATSTLIQRQRPLKRYHCDLSRAQTLEEGLASNAGNRRLQLPRSIRNSFRVG